MDVAVLAAVAGSVLHGRASCGILRHDVPARRTRCADARFRIGALCIRASVSQDRDEDRRVRHYLQRRWCDDSRRSGVRWRSLASDLRSLSQRIYEPIECFNVIMRVVGYTKTNITCQKTRNQPWDSSSFSTSVDDRAERRHIEGVSASNIALE